MTLGCRCTAPTWCAARTASFVVLEDRTQVPSGAGYALENRIVISGVLPEVFRDCNVERLALFFRTLRDTCSRWRRTTATTRASCC